MTAIEICDVGPRDGLQNEPEVLAPELRAALANRLALTGVARVEAASFVRDELVPQMAGAEQVAAALEARDGVIFAGLVLNRHGYERLRATALAEVHATFAASETFQRRNGGSSVAEGLARTAAVIAAAHADGRRATVTISTAFGCPFEGRADPMQVLDLVARCAAADADEVVLADTIGIAVPTEVRRAVERARTTRLPVGVHLHDTRNTAVACALAAVEAGATLVDASVGGIGGCPFAPRSTGNVATEDVVYALEREGVQTGVDLDALIRVAEWLERTLAHPLPGKVYRAGSRP
ncbi:Isopropylmalate/homocitrate/citramalate synthase [Gaiella occulta]|uniref:Isopropylmalate/homocitrate/citramalate synthase n=1 Tax=Gaiella occulta TaxID=1002870 RepID=A0A7M2Z1F7_9ACTN|nr:hydroxymethylglutaryl-CoA lyase [Gaiella occulta]RDI75622.1 Isopropylmalate/homocitrate/citramalate synthase [Gaiella occulta]